MAAGMNGLSAAEAKPRVRTIPDWSPLLRSLSEEIDALRKEMETIYEDISGFQSEELLAASQRLDLKINEFLHCQLS
ncbi:hypothetical protein VE23_24225 [Paenibacillus sp. D9]|uniref:aspartyl-phosphate phosphatase Spo0E family protein n=1 Tax=Paenibacillus TaxID=44249 RepID=UPI00061FD5A6|nr:MULTISPECIES: aspartyl-phosphate phosphatase Spo0E family protein [Paenibacillus]KKC49453.1 hypothetical protein VE23_24225 [Paenibacillus sp. D9]